MKQKRIIYIITSLRKSNSEDICHDKRETEKNCAGVFLGIADGGGYFKLHNVFRNSPVHFRDETPLHPTGGGSDDSLLSALDRGLLSGLSVLGAWLYSHCPGEPGDVPHLSGRRDDCEDNLPHLFRGVSHHPGAAGHRCRRVLLGTAGGAAVPNRFAGQFVSVHPLPGKLDLLSQCTEDEEGAVPVSDFGGGGNDNDFRVYPAAETARAAGRGGRNCRGRNGAPVGA